MNRPDSKARLRKLVHSSDGQYVDDIIFVGASTADDKIWGHEEIITSRSGSVYGSLVDVFAPGEDIRGAKHSTERSFSATDTWSGTSFVSPDNKGNLITTKSPQLHHMLRRHPMSLESLLVCSATLNIEILPQEK